MDYCSKRFTLPTELCLVFPNNQAAQACRKYIWSRALPSAPIRIAELIIPRSSKHLHADVDMLSPKTRSEKCWVGSLHVVLFPIDLFKFAKEFWQHTGEGVSSRFAEHCLRVLEALDFDVPRLPYVQHRPTKESTNLTGSNDSLNGYGRARYQCGPYSPPAERAHVNRLQEHIVSKEQDTFVEERFGRNIDTRFANEIKLALRKRIAGVLEGTLEESTKDIQQQMESLKIYSRGCCVNEDHVFLFANGMSTIYNTHRVVLALRPNMKSVQFG